MNYSPDHVTAALVRLVAVGGNVGQAAKELADTDHAVPEATLRGWKESVHQEQYERLERKYGEQLEAETIALTRTNMQQAAEIEAELLERCRSTTDPRLVPQALKAVADSRAKSVDKLIALTGQAPKERDEDFLGAVNALVAAGILSDPHGIANGSDPEKPAPRAPSGALAGDDGEAEATPPPEGENGS